MRWLHGITDLMDMCFSKLLEMMKDSEGLVCCSPWGHKESDTTGRLNNNVLLVRGTGPDISLMSCLIGAILDSLYPQFSLLLYTHTHSHILTYTHTHICICCSVAQQRPIFPSIRVFSNESALHIRWSNYWSFSFSHCPSNEYSGLLSFRIDWFDLLAVQGTLKSLL